METLKEISPTAQRQASLVDEHDSRVKACAWDPTAYEGIRVWIRALSEDDAALLWAALKSRIKAGMARK